MSTSIFRATTALLVVPMLAAAARAQGHQFTWPSPSGGYTACSAGDVDGDGVPDILLGAPGTDLSSLGSAEVRSGRTGLAILTLSGPSPGSNFGTAVAGLGDLDHDGRADFAVTRASASPAVTPWRVSVHSGSNGAELWHVDGPAGLVFFGKTLARVRDLDNDGVDELVVGAPSYPAGTIGSVHVFSGANGATLLTISGLAGASADFGTSISSAGDFDHDGLEDLLVGDPQMPYSLSLPGRVTVHSGANGAVLATFVGPVVNGGFGTDAATLGDIDGDGQSDFVVGAPAEAIASWNTGRVRVISGASGSILLTVQEGPNLVSFGAAVERAPDLDGDGRADVLLGAGMYRLSLTLFSPAEARVYSSATGTLLQIGLSSSNLVTVPDANGDGIDDYLVPSVSVQGLAAALALNHAPPPSFESACAPKTTSQGCQPWLESFGAPSTTIGDELHFVARALVPNTFGLCVWSLNSAQTPLAGGTLCVAAPVHRWPIANSVATPLGENCPGVISDTLTVAVSKARLAATGVLPGQQIFVQAWFRDPGFAPPNDVGLTSSLSVTMWP